MTNTNNTTTNGSTQTVDAINLAATLAVIELLENPEFNNNFIVELLETTGAEITDDNIQEVTRVVLALNHILAVPLINQLPEVHKETYN